MKRALSTTGAPAPFSAASLWLAVVAASVAAAQTPTTSPLAAAFEEALTRMRANQAPGLVFVLPPKDARADPKVAARVQAGFEGGKLRGGVPVALDTARDVMLMQIQALRGTLHSARDHARLTALFALTVVVVAEPAACAAQPGETIVLLAVDGTRAHGFAVDLGDRAAVLAALEPLVLTFDAVEPRRANVPPAVAAKAARRRDLRREFALRKQAGEHPTDLWQDLVVLEQELAAQLTAAAPALIEFAGEGDERHIVTDVPLAEITAALPPLGTEIGVQWDPCPPCGMMALPLPMRSALKLLAQ